MSLNNSVLAGFVNYKGKIDFFIEKDYSANVRVSIIVRNNGPSAVDLNNLAINFLQFNVNDPQVKLSVKDVDAKIDSTGSGTLLKLSARKNKKIILNSAQSIKIDVSAKLVKPYAIEGGGLKVFYYPADIGNFTVYLNIDSNISTNVDLKHSLVKGYKQYNLTKLAEEYNKIPFFTIFTGKPVTFIYQLEKKDSYILPANIPNCRHDFLLLPIVDYLIRDDFGISIPYKTNNPFYTSYIAETVETDCLLDSLEWSGVYYVGWYVSPVDTRSAIVVGYYKNGEFYLYDNNKTEKVNNFDKKGIFFRSILSCKDKDRCIQYVDNIKNSAHILNVEVQEKLDTQGSSSCDLANRNFLRNPKDIILDSGIIYNSTNECINITRIVCNPLNVLDNKELIIFPHGRFNLPECKSDQILIDKYTYTNLKFTENKFIFSLTLTLLLLTIVYGVDVIRCYNRNNE